MYLFITIALLFSCFGTQSATADTTQTVVATVDSLATQCQELQLNRDSVVAAFQSLDALLAGERIYYERSSKVDSQKSYCPATISSELTADRLAQKLSCTVPPSVITNSDYYVIVTYRRSEEYGDTPCQILDLNAYKHTTVFHLPIVRLTYCTTTGIRYYEYVTDRGTVYYTIE